MELSQDYAALSVTMASAGEQFHEILMELPDEERSIINQYVKSCADLQSEYAFLAYVAGLSDMLDILGQLGLFGCPFLTKKSPS